ncbi:MAG: hypothetical protein WDO73_33875 [Ignavibacteriota bacterium]
MTYRLSAIATLAFACLSPLSAQQGAGRGAAAANAGPPPRIEDRTNGMRKIDGYFPLYWDERTGSLFLEISRFDSDFLYVAGLAAGLGSNDIGLDRGVEGQGHVVSFQRIGPKVLLVQGNESFRSSSSNPAERRSVEDSFAKSVLWGFHGGGREQWPRPGGRQRFPAARWRRCGQRVAPRNLPGGSYAQRVLPGAHQGVPLRIARSR